MKIDFKQLDSSEQINSLQTLLQKVDPTKEDVASAMLLTLLIFYENRPGKIKDLAGYSAHGTGCHNPKSEKNNQIRFGIMRYEITLEHNTGPKLRISFEYVVGGYLNALFTKNETKYAVNADIIKDEENKGWQPIQIKITSNNERVFMEELNKFLNEPLNKILSENNRVNQSQIK